LLQPIAVREQKIERKGKLRIRIVLVAGAHRLAAARHLQYERVDCIYVDFEDEASVQLVQIGEDLFRKHLTVLRQAELVTKWYELVAKDSIYGQVDRENKRGRPPNGTSKIARDLFGITVDAWRKKLRRAKGIARIQPEAKQAAVDAGLDDNQQALLTIAAVKGRKAQLRKVAKLAHPSDKLHGPAADTDDDAAQSDKPSSDKLHSEEAEPKKPNKGHEQGAQPSQPETSFEQLEALWNKYFRRPWKYSPFIERERFITMLRRARNATGTDAVSFVKQIFQGREKIYARHLYAFAKSRRMSKDAVRRILSGLGYKRRRDGYGGWGHYLYLNANPFWKRELEAITEAELTGGKIHGWPT
jgi:ParB-like chromosome segregation protein Spo0J